jgi:YegS/Rv2252/BmrU family lipid kinase
MTKRTAVLIYNPRSGAHRRRDRTADVDAFVRRIGALGVDAEPRPTTGPSTAAGLARDAVREGVDLVIASGGDGTLNEVLQGMVGSRVPLAIWAGGTANVLARELGLPTEIEPVAEMIARGAERRIALGRANERYFFLMAGIGLDASIVRDVSPALKARVGEGAFWVSGLKHCVAWRPEPFDLVVDGMTYTGAFAAVGNASSYGGSFSVTPHARISEALLDVCIFPTRRFALMYMKDLVACVSGDPTRFGDVLYMKAQSLTATGAPDNQPWVQVDGELLGQLPMTFAAVPDALSVVVPTS